MLKAIESKNELLSQKELIINQLEAQIIDLKDQNQAINDELVLKNDEIDENKSKLIKVEGYTGLSIEEILKKPSKSGMHMIKDGKILEISDENDEVKVINRERIKERDDFILWVDGKQLCGVLNNSKWVLSLYLGVTKVDIVEIVGNTKDCDKFHLINNKIYIGIYETFELYRITVEDKQMKLESFGKMKNHLHSLCEYKDYFLIGLCDYRVYQVKDGQITEILKMSNYVSDLRVENDCLLAIDYIGKAVKYNLLSKETEKTVNIGSNYAFILGDKIGGTDRNKLYIHDWEGVQLKEFSYSGGNYLLLLKQTEKYSVIAYNNCLLTINHATLEVNEHKTGEIPRRYLNYC